MRWAVVGRGERGEGRGERRGERRRQRRCVVCDVGILGVADVRSHEDDRLSLCFGDRSCSLLIVDRCGHGFACLLTSVSSLLTPNNRLLYA